MLLTQSRKMRIKTEEIEQWEKEYLSLKKGLSDRERALLQGDPIKSHEGMLFGSMYSDWKKQKGLDT